MAVQRGWPNAGHQYANVFKPGQIFLNFVIDSANGNGLGVRSIKSNGFVNNVFMHTSASAGIGRDNQLNPNPAVGYVLVQMKNAFNVYLGGFSGFVSPTTGGTSGNTTNHVPAIIATLGTTTLAQWQAAGVRAGLTPAVGMSFVAIKTGAIGGTGTIIAAGVSGIASAEVIGDPNQSIQNSSIAANGGAWTLIQLLNAAGAPTAPADGSVLGMSFFYDQSSVTVDGL